MVANVKMIFGVKLRQLRKKRGYSLKELAKRAQLSVSYLNEIENGKKYPKADKIQSLAQALEVDFDFLVSQRLDDRHSYIQQVLDSSALHKFPFHLFGIELQDLFSLIPNAPNEGQAFVKALFETARGYDMRINDFLHTALRCYQEMNGNYFKEIESAVIDFRKEVGWRRDEPLSLNGVVEALQERYGASTDLSELARYESLNTVRSLCNPDSPNVLYVNPRLSELQKVFMVAREIGYRKLSVSARGAASPDFGVDNFERVLNAFKASYFASALFMDPDTFAKRLSEYFSQPRWDAEGFRDLIESFGVTPEMFFYRLSEVLPHSFSLDKLHFLRFDHAQSGGYQLTKKLNMSQVHIPTGLELHESFCRRWLSIRVIQDYVKQYGYGPGQQVVGVQRSTGINQKDEFLCFAVAQPLSLESNTITSVTIGFQVNARLRKHIAFLDDGAIPREVIGETCERCPLLPDECLVRSVEPVIFDRRQLRKKQRSDIEKLLGAEFY